ncbi:MAG: molybdopterin-dependent oxidoreductase [Actinobacteria bacterium]|nr:molybdopterin-dependent oxidoreductase [Actinomycetota bacterium]
MADGGTYRAVFLRVHPTGKAVLSLTTQGGGSEGELAKVMSEELGLPPADIKIVPEDLDRFGEGHGFATSPGGGTAQAVRSVSQKIRSKAQTLAGMLLNTSANSLSWDGVRFTAGGSEQGKTIADIALFAHSGGYDLPPGMEGSLDAQTVYRD